MKKLYKSVSGKHYTFPVTVSNEKRWIDVNPSYYTDDIEEQKAIELYPYFKQGIISTPDIEEEIKEPEKTTLEAANWQDAADVLKREPYRIHHSKLKTPDMIKDQADLLGITFNL